MLFLFISSIFYITVLHNSIKFGSLSKSFILLVFLLGICKYILGIESKILPLNFYIVLIFKINFKTNHFLLKSP